MSNSIKQDLRNCAVAWKVEAESIRALRGPVPPGVVDEVRRAVKQPVELQLLSPIWSPLRRWIREQ
jgi:hypothetical protein